jgi:hypothetical protein
MRNNEGYFYRFNKTKGIIYVQIWKRDKTNGSGAYIRTCGSADSLNKKLVKLELLEIQTKKIGADLTNILESKKEEKTKSIKDSKL